MRIKYNDFADIQHRPLRIYNRAVTAFNIRDDFGKVDMEEYLSQFSKQERLEIAQMTALTRIKGAKFMKELVTNGVEFVDTPYVGEE